MARGEIIAHLLVRCGDEPGIVAGILDPDGGSVAPDVLFLCDFRKVRPFADAVADVLKNLLLSLGAGSASKEQLPERLLVRGHVSSCLLCCLPLLCPPAETVYQKILRRA
jgi:hypothetical protein